MRREHVITMFGASLAALAVAATSAGAADPTDAAREHASPQPARAAVEPDPTRPSSLWYVKGDTYQRTVRTWIGRTPWRHFDGKPVQFQYRPVDGGRWRLAGKARQQAGPDAKWARGTVRFEFDRTGDFKVRVRAKVGNRWRVHAPKHYTTVTKGPVPYDPKPIRKVSLAENIALGWKRGYLAYGLSYDWDHPEMTVRKGLDKDGEFYFGYGTDFDSADRANVLAFSNTIIHGEDVYGERVATMRPASRKLTWVSYRRDGTRTPYTTGPAISDTARWVSYSSFSRKIVANTPKGHKVFLADMRAKKPKSRYVGRGHHTGISGNGRFVAFVRGKKVFCWDRRSGETVQVASVSRATPGKPLVSDNGRYVVFTRVKEGKQNFHREVIGWDRRTGESSVISEGTHPVMTDDGRYVAFSGPGFSKYGHTDVARWDRRTGKVTIASVGPDGDGTDNPTDDVDMSENGRWIVTSFGLYRDPASPDVTLPDAVIFDMSATP